MSFSVEVMVKGYQLYKDSWAAVLGKEMPCWREVGILVNVSQNFLTYAEGKKGMTHRVVCVVKICWGHAANATIRTVKVILKQVHHFSEILHPDNSCYAVQGECVCAYCVIVILIQRALPANTKTTATADGAPLEQVLG